MVDFTLTDEKKVLRELAHDFAAKEIRPQVNLVVDHSRIVQLECVRRGIWGTKSRWGRVATYPGG